MTSVLMLMNDCLSTLYSVTSIAPQDIVRARGSVHSPMSAAADMTQSNKVTFVSPLVTNMYPETCHVGR